MFAGKPIIGIAGGIGSGKSFVADLFGELGCCVIHADEQVHAVYRERDVLETIVSWWGPGVLLSNGQVDRKAIARRFLQDEKQRKRLEGLLHPRVALMRQEIMQTASRDARTLGYVWDTPLLFEAGLHVQCDTVVFVACPRGIRLARVMASRGWDDAELMRRENLQWPLDSKREIAEYVVDNTADVENARRQVKDLLRRIGSRWLD